MYSQTATTFAFVSADSGKSAQPGPQQTTWRNFLSGLRLVITAILIPVLVSITTSFYVNTHLLKPRVKANISWGDVMVMRIEGHPNDYVAALVDFWPGVILREDSPNKALNATGGEIVSAKRLSFKSANDYEIDSRSVSSRIMKLMLVNDGYVTATHIKLGIDLPEGSTNWKIIPSPNIKILQESVIASSGVNPALVNVEIDRLGASEKAVLTASTDWQGRPKAAPNQSPYITIHKTPGWRPLAYVSSDEGTGTIAPEVSWRDAMNWEEGNFPDSVIGFWASRIHPKQGIVPSIHELKELEMGYDLVNDAGEQTGTGTLRLKAER